MPALPQPRMTMTFRPTRGFSPLLAACEVDAHNPLHARATGTRGDMPGGDDHPSLSRRSCWKFNPRQPGCRSRWTPPMSSRRASVPSPKSRRGRRRGTTCSACRPCAPVSFVDGTSCPSPRATWRSQACDPAADHGHFFAGRSGGTGQGHINGTEPERSDLDGLPMPLPRVHPSMHGWDTRRCTLSRGTAYSRAPACRLPLHLLARSRLYRSCVGMEAGQRTHRARHRRRCPTRGRAGGGGRALRWRSQRNHHGIRR